MNRPKLASASFRFSAVLFLVISLTITDVSASDLSRSCPGFQREVPGFEPSQFRVNNRRIREDPARPTRLRPFVDGAASAAGRRQRLAAHAPPSREGKCRSALCGTLSTSV
uniref:Putative secreted protein n=1 Tax=Ixodes scapularis TaxID=6945 RepID=A0A4D5RY89_IXOSC